ncbi:MAG: hypothetical protein AB1847_05370 [bacterium]
MGNLIGEWLGVIPGAYLWENSLVVPLWQMGLYIIVISFCLLFKRYRLGLSTSFIFCFYWGFVANRSLLVECTKSADRFSLPFFLYVAGGFVLVVLSVIAFFSSDD